MYKAIRYISVCGAVLFAVMGPNACGGGSGDVVARIGGRPITKAIFDHWLSVPAAADSQTVSSRATTDETLRQRVLDFLISSQWTIGEATELGVKVTDGEAQKQLERFKYVRLEGIKYERFPNEAQLKRSLAGPGETRSDQVWLMKLNMLTARIEQERLAEARQQITHAQVTRYYEENKRRFLLPEQRDIEIILTYNEATTKKAKQEIESGKSFLRVAKRVSVDSEAPEGVQHLVRGEEEEEFINHVFAAKPHVLVGPVHQALDYYIFEVTKITQASRQTLARSEASIRQWLAVRQLRQMTTKLLAAFERKWTAKTSCRPGYVVAKCRRYPHVLT
ncbi:MAG TPA: peptidyl-prolyl cis-trans isomerase [Solirubrobacteraceae bacterium]